MNRHERESYDALLDGGFVEVTACGACGGDPELPPCSEDCEAVLLEAARCRRIKGCYKAARKALAFARIYLMQSDDRDDHRVRACIATVRHYREEIRIARMLRVFESDDLAEAAQ